MGLRCLDSQAPSPWSRQLVWDIYAHNSLICVSSGFYALQCLATALIQICRCTRARARQCLQTTSTHDKKMADCRGTKGPHYQVCQRVCRFTHGLPLCSDSRKLAPQFVGPFPVSKIVNPVAVKLRLPITTRIHPTFHLRWIKPVVESLLVLAMENLYAVKKLLAVHQRGWARQYLTGRETWESPRSWFLDCSLTSLFA